MREELPTSPTWQPPSFDLRLIPLFGTVGLAVGINMARRIPEAVVRSVHFVEHNGVLATGSAVAIGAGAFVLVGQRYWLAERALPQLLSTLAAASLTALGGFFMLAAQWPEALRLLLSDARWQCGAFGVTLAWYALAWILTRSRKAAVAEPFQVAVLKQQDTYDYTLGAWHADDWENAVAGVPGWLTWPEAGTYCNMLLLGAIGSGKTSELLGSIQQQAIGKFPDDRDKQVALLIIDRKGNQAAAVYRWAQEMGREADFRVVRPDIAQNEHGEPLIPLNRYASFSPLQGFDEPALLASELQDALESAKGRRSPDYFQNVQKEFLTHALTLLLARDAHSDLADLQAFAAMDDVRKTLLNASTDPALQRAVVYFRGDFGKLSSQDQADLLRGLSSQLTLLTNPAVQSAFCPTRPSAHSPLGSWQACLMEQPGIVVFSCPPAVYTRGLSRLMALLFSKSFQQAMERRSDDAFTGNKKRPVVMFADEAHYVFNQGMASFFAVSRDARAINILATQNFGQIPPEYRAEMVGGCRTHLLLGSDADTAREFEDSLGTITEVTETVSFSEGQRPTTTATTGGAAGTVSTTRAQSYSKRERPRFSTHALRHIPLGRGVAHIFDGVKLRPSCAFKTMPWYRLPFYLLDPMRHPHVACKSGERHDYRRASAGGLTCKNCQKTLTSQEASDYRAVLPALRTMTTPQVDSVPAAGGT